MGAQTHTQLLLAKKGQHGAVIKCGRAAHEGQEVVYAPRWESGRTGDAWAWVLKSDPEGPRFTGGQCYACY